MSEIVPNYPRESFQHEVFNDFQFSKEIISFIVQGRISKSTWGEQPVEDIFKFPRIFMYVFIYLCASRLLAKRKTIQTWNLAHILPLNFSENGFFVFSIKSPWLPLASKNCRVTWIFRISPRLPCCFFNQDISYSADSGDWLDLKH